MRWRLGILLCEATDDDGVSNNGSIAGTYELLPPPALAVGLAGRAVAGALLLVVTAFAMANRRSGPA